MSTLSPTLSHAEPTALQTLLNRDANPVTREAAIKPEHRAREIAAMVAANGSPSGA